MITKELYSEKYNFKYYHVPKNGITSILRVCINDGKALNSISSNWVDVDSIPDDAKTICVLREPVSRFVSGFLQGKTMLNYYLQHKQVDKETGVRFGLCRKVDDGLLRNIYKNTSALDGMKILIEEMIERGNLEHHTMRQSDFINYKERYYNTDFKINRDTSSVDIFLDHKTLSTKIKEFDERIDLPHLNKNASVESNKLKELAYKLEPLLLECYKEDFELYKNKLVL